ncbi:MAG: hypothetical protein WC683_01475 [bacterium]
MALSVSTQVSPVGSKLIVETGAGVTPDTDVTGGAGTLYMIDVDNTGNPADQACLKVYDSAAPTVGTTAPELVVRVPANQRRSVVVPEGWGFAHLSFACVTSPGTAGVVAPANPVIVRMVAS